MKKKMKTTHKVQILALFILLSMVGCEREEPVLGHDLTVKIETATPIVKQNETAEFAAKVNTTEVGVGYKWFVEDSLVSETDKFKFTSRFTGSYKVWVQVTLNGFTAKDSVTVQVETNNSLLQIVSAAKSIERSRVLQLEAKTEGLDNIVYQWTINGQKAGNNGQTFNFVRLDMGTYNVKATVYGTNGARITEDSTLIEVTRETIPFSPAISRVIEYKPAPGQHINRLFPPANMSDTYENALQFANNALTGNKSMLGLGAFGGYVIVGFDHSIVNVPGEYDFKVLGNAFEGWAEPGIVMVAQDINQNGQIDADEPWYELAGSEYAKPETIHDYEITYYRPEPDGQKSNIRWTDNKGGEGVVTHINFAPQKTMYPLWVKENAMTFKGTKLKSNLYDKNGSGTSWVNTGFDWGYADNQPNNAPIEQNGFNIDWAVDGEGKVVHLEYVDFVRIHTAQVGEGGWLGEISTEVSGVTDLHINN